MFVDSHAHLDGKQFDTDRQQVIARAREAGVQTMVAIGNGDGPPTLDAGIQLADKFPFIYATIGIHPHEARLADDAAYQTMERLARHPKVIAWGEIGLDYYYDHSPRDTQKQVFSRQMELAAAAKLPIVIHNRPSDGSDNAWDDCLAMINQQWASNGLVDSALLHGKLGQAKRALDMGHDFFAGKSPSQGTADSRRALQVPRPHVHRDRLSVSGSHPTSREAQRTGVRKRNRPQDRRTAWAIDGRSRGADRPQFLRIFQNL
jgi:TatD DNase family protein